ncbi:unnamed protein product, partial [Owenia fusiformis]
FRHESKTNFTSSVINNKISTLRVGKMVAGLDQTVGMAMMGFAGAIFAYYTIWVIVLPFVDADHIVHQYFLPRMYAVTLPLLAGVALLAFIGAFVLYMTNKSKKPKEKSS